VLPRPEGLQRLFDAGPREREAFDAALPAAVADVVARQVAAGVDIVNDGEVSKRGLFIGYIRDRMSGFEERTVPAGEFRPRNAGVTGRDSRDFPGFYAARLGGFPVRRLVVPGQGGAPVTEYVCDGPLRYTGAADARADIGRLAAAAVAHGVEAFLPAITPGTVEHWLRNEYYPHDESFLAAIADVLHEEYKTITDAGLLLQVDDPDLPDGWQMFPDMTVRIRYFGYPPTSILAIMFVSM
jgi:5-methyltetrahydropteroyltriglutamate--homocysteine methyltransferase